MEIERTVPKIKTYNKRSIVNDRDHRQRLISRTSSDTLQEVQTILDNFCDTVRINKHASHCIQWMLSFFETVLDNLYVGT